MLILSIDYVWNLNQNLNLNTICNDTETGKIIVSLSEYSK